MGVSPRLALVFVAATAAGFAQEPVAGKWRAPITVVAEDDFTQGTSRTRYFIDLAGRKVEVLFDAGAPDLVSGQMATVRGVLSGGKLTGATADAEHVPAAATQCSTTGEQKLAILMLQFPGVPFPTSIISPSDLHDMYFSTTRVSVDAYLRDASYGQTFATGDVFGPFMLDQFYDFETQQSQGVDAAIRAADSSVDFSVYNHVVFVWPAPGVSGWGGRAGVGCATLNSPSKGTIAGTTAILGVGTAQPYSGLVSLAAHEEGHSLGLNHASSLDYAPQTLGPPGVDGVHKEYGDIFSIMGGGEGQLLLGHFAAPHKSKLGWLDPSSILNVQTDGSFVLQPYENTSGTRALRVQRGAGSNEWLWLEYRQSLGYDATLAGAGGQVFSGALVHFEDPTQDPNHSLLLDFTPSTPHDFSDPALAAGQAWSDAYSPLSIRVNSATAAGLSVDVSYRAQCATLSPVSRSHGAGAETGSFSVSAASDCAWTAVSTAAWITVTAGASGTGAGTVSYALAANITQGPRTGSIFVGFDAFTITQAASSVSQAPSLDSLTPNSGTGLSQAFTFVVSDPNGAANLRNIDIDFVRTGFICQVSYTFQSFTTATGFFVAGQSVAFRNDDGTFTGLYPIGSNLALQNSECALDVSAFTVTSSGNSMHVTFPMVFMSAGTWSIQVNLYNMAKSHIFAFAGSWNTQNTCSFTLAPTSLAVGMNETAGSIALAADPGCPWMASGTPPWIKISSAVRSTGGGAISYDIAANPSGAPRNGTITIGGIKLAVSQSTTAGTPPAITSVVNGASFLTGLSAATWITILGTNLGPPALTWTAADFAGNRLPAQLGGVSVFINGIPAFMYYVSPTQLNLLAPDDGTIGPVQVEVDTPDGRSAPFTAQKQPLSPAFFLFAQGGNKYAASVHIDGTYVGSANLIPGVTSRPAAPGEVILLFGTGFGATNPAVPTATLVAKPEPLIAPVTIRIGGVVAKVMYAGLVASGEYQFNVTVPDLPSGDQSITTEIGGASSQPNVFVTVGR